MVFWHSIGRIPFAFLEDIHQRFVRTYGRAVLSAQAYAMNDEFSRVLSQQMEYYSNDPNADRINRLKGEMSQVSRAVLCPLCCQLNSFLLFLSFLGFLFCHHFSECLVSLTDKSCVSFKWPHGSYSIDLCSVYSVCKMKFLFLESSWMVRFHVLRDSSIIHFFKTSTFGLWESAVIFNLVWLSNINLFFFLVAKEIFQHLKEKDKQATTFVLKTYYDLQQTFRSIMKFLLVWWCIYMVSQ